MARRWLRDANTNVLTGGVTDNDGLTAASGFNYVSDAAIRTVAGDVLIGPGDTFTGIVYTPRPGLTEPELVESRRRVLAPRIYRWATLPLEGVKEYDSDRVVAYFRKVQADARAFVVDANLSDGTRYNLLLAEVSQEPSRWAWKFQHTQWTTAGRYTGTDWSNYLNTTTDINSDADADNIGPTAQASITMHTAGGFDFFAEIGKFR